MTGCKHCGRTHKTADHYKLVEKLSDKGFPTHSKRYAQAHREADKEEKKRFPKGYEELKKIDSKLGRHELIGKNSSSGKIEVSRKAPSKLRKEIAIHEKTENKILRKKK